MHVVLYRAQYKPLRSAISYFRAHKPPCSLLREGGEDNITSLPNRFFRYHFFWTARKQEKQEQKTGTPKWFFISMMSYKMAYSSQLHSHPEFQNGGRQSGDYISPVKHYVYCNVAQGPPIGTKFQRLPHMFMAPKLRVLLWMLSRVIGSRKFKIAATKPLIHTQIHVLNTLSISSSRTLRS